MRSKPQRLLKNTQLQKNLKNILRKTLKSQRVGLIKLCWKKCSRKIVNIEAFHLEIKVGQQKIDKELLEEQRLSPTPSLGKLHWYGTGYHPMENQALIVRVVAAVS